MQCLGLVNRMIPVLLGRNNFLIPLKTNIPPENQASQKEGGLPTINAQLLRWFQGGYCIVKGQLIGCTPNSVPMVLCVL